MQQTNCTGLRVKQYRITRKTSYVEGFRYSFEFYLPSREQVRAVTQRRHLAKKADYIDARRVTQECESVLTAPLPFPTGVHARLWASQSLCLLYTLSRRARCPPGRYTTLASVISLALAMFFLHPGRLGTHAPILSTVRSTMQMFMRNLTYNRTCKRTRNQ